MKKIILFMSLLAICSCTMSDVKGDGNVKYIKSESLKKVFKVVEIDSCEYIVAHGKFFNGLTHKGNCKFCKERSKEE